MVFQFYKSWLQEFFFSSLHRTYQDLELCLSTSKSCPQIHMMAPYFARKYTEYMSICPLPMPVRTSTTTPTPVQTSTASLEQETTLDSEPDEYLTVKDLITTVVSTIHSAIIMSSSTKGKIYEDRVRSKDYNRFTYRSSF